jgi:L-ribulose-5-phosphate 3-epimerase
MNHSLGVCSWSLKADRVPNLVHLIREVGVNCVQLGLDPLIAGAWSVPEVLEAFDTAKVQLRSGMIGTKGEDYSTPASIRASGGIRPNEHWSSNLQAAEKGAIIARELGINLVSFHAGYLPHDRSDPERSVLVERLGRVVDVFADQNVRVALETGQEQATTLLEFLHEIDRPTLGVNFDPANMILYSMGDPVAALGLLGSQVFQVHIKDAVGSGDPEVWGQEVPVGDGEVDWRAFFDVLQASGNQVDLMIEREAGESRVQDMQCAKRLLEGLGIVRGEA